MLFRNVTLDQLRLAADEASVRLINLRPEGRGYRATLGLIPDPEEPNHLLYWQRRSIRLSGERKVNAVCWHGHAVFFAKLFARCPDAVVTGGRENAVRYEGARGFLATFRATGEWNIGSLVYPLRYQDACYCSYFNLEQVEEAIRGLEAATRREDDSC